MALESIQTMRVNATYVWPTAQPAASLGGQRLAWEASGQPGRPAGGLEASGRPGGQRAAWEASGRPGRPAAGLGGQRPAWEASGRPGRPAGGLGGQRAAWRPAGGLEASGRPGRPAKKIRNLFDKHRNVVHTLVENKLAPMRWTYGEPKRMRGLFSFSFNSVRVNMESYEVRGNFFPVNCDSEKDPVLTTVKTEEEAQKEIDFYVNLGIPRKELYFQKIG
jgi:hypothetical protein